MKKLFTTLALGTICAAGAFAQKDVDLEITTMASMTTLEPGESATFSFEIKNNGPDVITSSDTIVVDYGGDDLIPVVVSSPLAAGASVSSGDVLSLTHPNSDTQTVDWVVDLCFQILPQSAITISGRPLTVTYEDSDTTNDISCVTMTIKDPASIANLKGLDKVQLSVYPNPANNNINFTYSFEKVSDAAVARILDITGRIVMTHNFGKQTTGEQSFSLNVASLPAGMYTLEFVTENNRGISKFTKAR